MWPQSLTTTQRIHAPPATVWQALTQPALIQQWLAQPEVGVSIHTDWTVGSPILITGFHHLPFQNRGLVLQVEPVKRLRYSQLSSLSELPDIPENYTIFDFQLSKIPEETLLTLTISQFATESIYKHVEFYWRITLVVLGRFIESQGRSATKTDSA